MNSSERCQVTIVILAWVGVTDSSSVKWLTDVAGKPIIQHVHELAKKVVGVDAVLVATDDERVSEAVTRFGGMSLTTTANYSAGIEWLNEVVASFPSEVYLVNQSDEPLVRLDDLSSLVRVMRDDSVQVGTLCYSIDAKQAASPNCVKVVMDRIGNALYFSRSPIPYQDSSSPSYFLMHLPVYAYRRTVLSRYSALPRSLIEEFEVLEQLRLLANGERIRVLEVPPLRPSADVPDGLERVRDIIADDSPPTGVIPLRQVRLVITDVDGVLTDGGIYYDESGECQKRFHVRDGLGMRLLEENGIRVAVLSGRDSPSLRKRVQDLGIVLCQFGVKDKALGCESLMDQAGVTAEQTVCIGDDSIDLPAFAVCGRSFAVADAPDYVKRQATEVLSHRGGEGAFREVADAILLAQGKEHVLGTAKGYESLMAKMAQ